MSDFQKYFPQIQYMKKQGQAYLDSAATTLKPQAVIDSLTEFYTKGVSNVHRGDHYMSEVLTLKYEDTRAQIQKWIQAQSAEEIIFTKNTTESINFLSFALEDYFKEGDTILLTEMEHHSNLLPWQALARRKNLKLHFLPVNNLGELLVSKWDQVVTKSTKLLAFPYYSNALGLRNPVEKLLELSRKRGILTSIDAAQAMASEAINVQNLNCDFLTFSGHKIFAPMGLGVLYVRKKHFDILKPWQAGGGMVTDVSLYEYEKADPPQCFEAGTPPIEGVLGLSASLNFLKEQNYFEQLKTFKTSILAYAKEELNKIEGLKIIGVSPNNRSIISFVLDSAHCRDVGQIISQTGVAVRSGHHCCLPLIKKLNLPSGTVRASFALYNDKQDVDLLISAIKKAKQFLA